MIIARICGEEGEVLFHGSVEILGAPAKEGYRLGGWFPVESFGFGFDEPPKGDDKPATDPAAKDKKAPPPVKKAEEKGKNDTSKMTIDKNVDMATTHMMLLAMNERSRKKGDKVVKLNADIHVLGSVGYKDTEERHVFPSIIVHMEGVHVVNWHIKASGDGRPTESCTLEYDKVAMQYTWTKDGKYLEPLTRAGWDLKLQKPWGDGADDINPPFTEYLPKFSK